MGGENIETAIMQLNSDATKCKFIIDCFLTAWVVATPTIYHNSPACVGIADELLTLTNNPIWTVCSCSSQCICICTGWPFVF